MRLQWHAAPALTTPNPATDHTRNGRMRHDCPAVGTRCESEHPLSASRVSREVVCAAYHRYRSRALEAASI